MGDLQAHLPPPHWVFSSFWPKMAWYSRPTIPIHPILPPSDFLLFPCMKEVLKGKHFVDVEEVKQNTEEALKGIKIEFKNCFEQGKKTSR